MAFASSVFAWNWAARSSSTMSGLSVRCGAVCADSLERVANARSPQAVFLEPEPHTTRAKVAPGAQENSAAHACRRKSRTTVPVAISAEEMARADLRAPLTPSPPRAEEDPRAGHPEND